MLDLQRKYYNEKNGQRRVSDNESAAFNIHYPTIRPFVVRRKSQLHLRLIVQRMLFTILQHYAALKESVRDTESQEWY